MTFSIKKKAILGATALLTGVASLVPISTASADDTTKPSPIQQFEGYGHEAQPARIKKLDYDTKKPLKGAVFEVKKLDDEGNVVATETITTGKDGYATTQMTFNNEIIHVHEVSAPEGYRKLTVKEASYIVDKQYESMLGYFHNPIPLMNGRTAYTDRMLSELEKNEKFVEHFNNHEVILRGYGAYPDKDRMSQYAITKEKLSEIFDRVRQEHWTKVEINTSDGTSYVNEDGVYLEVFIKALAYDCTPEQVDGGTCEKQNVSENTPDPRWVPDLPFFMRDYNMTQIDDLFSENGTDGVISSIMEIFIYLPIKDEYGNVTNGVNNGVYSPMNGLGAYNWFNVNRLEPIQLQDGFLFKYYLSSLIAGVTDLRNGDIVLYNRAVEAPIDKPPTTDNPPTGDNTDNNSDGTDNGSTTQDNTQNNDDQTTDTATQESGNRADSMNDSELAVTGTAIGLLAGLSGALFVAGVIFVVRRKVLP